MILVTGLATKVSVEFDGTMGVRQACTDTHLCGPRGERKDPFGNPRDTDNRTTPLGKNLILVVVPGTYFMLLIPLPPIVFIKQGRTCRTQAPIKALPSIFILDRLDGLTCWCRYLGQCLPSTVQLLEILFLMFMTGLARIGNLWITQCVFW